jgi:hypothetical protein
MSNRAGIGGYNDEDGEEDRNGDDGRDVAGVRKRVGGVL